MSLYPEASDPEVAPDPQLERRQALQNLGIVLALGVAAVIWWDFFRVPVMFVVTLGVLVAVHEWGHFVAARSAGVRVYEFALGMGPRLITYMRRNGTDYTIRAIPIGGFVNPKGMQPDDPITPDGLNGKRPAERALVFLAGPLMNVILAAIVACSIGAVLGTMDDSVQLVGEVKRKSVAERMGLRVGDRLLRGNGQPITSSDDVFRLINPNPGKEIALDVERDGKVVSLRGTPEAYTDSQTRMVVTGVPAGTDLAVKAGDQPVFIDGKLFGLEGFRKEMAARVGQPVTLTVYRHPGQWLDLKGKAAPVEVGVQRAERTFGRLYFTPVPSQGKRVSVGESVQQGLVRMSSFFIIFAQLFKEKKVGENLGGPVEIYNIVGTTTRLPAMHYFHIVAQLSLSLAVFNLLPVPMLDGGHMLLLTVEVLRRRRLEPQTQKVVQLVGLSLIGMLFVFIMFKDILKQVG